MTAPSVAASVQSALRRELRRGSLGVCPVQLPLALLAADQGDRAREIADGLVDGLTRNQLLQDIAVTWAGGSRLSDAVDTCLLIDDAASATRAVLAVLDALPLGSLPAASPVEEMFALALSRMQQVTDPATRAALIGELCQVAARHPDVRDRLPAQLDDARRLLLPLGSSAAVDGALAALVVAAAEIARHSLSLDLAQQISSASRRAAALTQAAMAAVRVGDSAAGYLDAASQTAARLPPAGRAAAAIDAARVSDLPIALADRVREDALTSLGQVPDARRQVLLIAELIPLLPPDRLTAVLIDAVKLLRGVRPEQRLAVRCALAGSLLDCGQPAHAQQFLPAGDDDVPAATDGAATDGAATDGAATDGAATDGAATDRATALSIGRLAARLARWELLEWSVSVLAGPADRAMLYSVAIGELGDDDLERQAALVSAARLECDAITDPLVRAGVLAELAIRVPTLAELLQEAEALVVSTTRAGWIVTIVSAVAVCSALDGQWAVCRRAVLVLPALDDRRTVLSAVGAVPGASEQVDWFRSLLGEFRAADDTLILFATAAADANRAGEAMDIALLLPDRGGPGSRSGVRQQLIEQIIVKASRVGDVSFAQDADKYLSDADDRARILATVIAVAVERGQLAEALDLRDLLPDGRFTDSVDAELVVAETVAGDVDSAVGRLSGLTDPFLRARAGIGMAAVLLPTARSGQARSLLREVIAIATSPVSQPFRAELYNELGCRLYRVDALELFWELVPRGVRAVDLAPVTDSLVAAALEDRDPDLAARMVHELGLRRAGFAGDVGPEANRNLAAIAAAALRHNKFALLARLAAPLPAGQRQGLLTDAVRAAAVAHERADMIQLAAALIDAGDTSPIGALALSLAGEDRLFGAATDLVDVLVQPPVRDDAFAKLAEIAAEAGEVDEARALIGRIAHRAPERPAALVRCSVVLMLRANVLAFRSLVADSPSAAVTVAMARAAAMAVATHRPELVATILQAADGDLPAHEQEQLEAVLVEAAMAAAQAGADVRSIAGVLGLGNDRDLPALPAGSESAGSESAGSESGRPVPGAAELVVAPPVVTDQANAQHSSVLQVVRLAASQDQLRLATALALATPDAAHQAAALRVIGDVLVESGQYTAAVDLLGRIRLANLRGAALQAVADAACAAGRWGEALSAARAIVDPAHRVQALSTIADAAAAAGDFRMALTAATDTGGARGQLRLSVRVLAQALTATECAVGASHGSPLDDDDLDAAVRSLMRLIARHASAGEVVGVFAAAVQELGPDALAQVMIRLCGVGLTADLCVAAAAIDPTVIDRVLDECERLPN